MKTLLIIFLLAGCVTPPLPCPRVDMVTATDDCLMLVPQGFYDDDTKRLAPEFDKALKRWLKSGEDKDGICGSGILDTMAQLHLSGVIGRRGKLGGDHPRIRDGQEQREFVLVENQDGHSEIVVTQHDIRELQIAKAAISAGIQALLETNHCTAEDIRQVIIAGAFGNYIDISSAITIGMLPALPLERFHQVGNAASTGARLALISLKQRILAQKIARKVHYLELARVPDFMQLLIQASYIGPVSSARQP